MNISIRILITVIVATLLGGLLIGWLVFGGRSGSEHSHTEVINGETVWTCSMHPQIRQNEAGSCPICGMNLIPLDEEGGDDVDPKAVYMSPTAIQLASISTAIVGEGQATKTIRLNGKVQADERLIFSQVSHIPGRIETLSVNFTGEYVSKGATIATLYSPELVTAQEELFEAYKIRESQPKLYQAAREKLKNWKLSEGQIDEILTEGKVREQFPIKADQSGNVISKMVNLGDYIGRGQVLYEITNLSRVWVLFDIYESDIVWTNTGDPVTFTISSLPGQTFEGKIDYIDPIIDPKTRVAKGRVVVSNNDQKLKPEMFASGIIEDKTFNKTMQLTIPKSAVMWTGKRSVVYEKLLGDKGLYFIMREVVLGPALGEEYLVEEGLEAGVEIAVNGTFSIDAAAQLAGKPSMMTEESKKAELPKINTSESTFESSPAFKEQLASVFEMYLPLKDALVQTNSIQARVKAASLLEAINRVDMSQVNGEAYDEWMKDLKVLESVTKFIAKQTDIEVIREALSPLSDQLFHSIVKFNVETGGFRQYCPMAFNNTGAYWLSNSDEVLNPYFGDVMLTCGNVEEELK